MNQRAPHSSLPLLLYRRLGRALGSAIDARRGAPALVGDQRRYLACQVWVHAASLGELEILTPVIEALAREGKRVGVTIFSQSALRALRKLAPGVAFAEFSPVEGAWGAALSEAKPQIFLTARYEAWPELWASLAERKIPLVIVGAKLRPSLIWASRLVKVLRSSVPRISFLSVSKGDQAALEATFPGADGHIVQAVGDPRWDRLAARNRSEPARAQELGERLKQTVPAVAEVAVAGSVWPSDFKMLEVGWRSLAGEFLPNSGKWLFIFPHQTDASHQTAILRELARLGFRDVRSSDTIGSESAGNSGGGVVLVNEVGFLAEFYRYATWAYVGGGFEAGVHSTMEPAFFGIPVSAGPKRAESFPEIRELTEAGQLEVVRDAAAWLRWLESGVRRIDLNDRTRRLEQARGRQGATAKVVAKIRPMLT